MNAFELPARERLQSLELENKCVKSRLAARPSRLAVLRGIAAATVLAIFLSAAVRHAHAQEPLNIVTVAGRNAEIGDGGPATSAQLNLPGAVAFDYAGNHYITEGAGHRVRKVDAAGIITTFAGTGGSGYNGDYIPATEAQLSAPRGVVVDSSGNLFIVENGGHRVRKVNLATGIITTVAGTGIAGSTGDSGPATAAQLNAPGFAIFDSSGNLYISEVNGNRIRKVVPGSDGIFDGSSDEIITTVAGTGVAGFMGDGFLATAAQFRSPNAISLDSAGNLYIADVTNNRVRKVNLATGIITTVAGPGVVNLLGDGGPATAAWLNGPRTVAVDSSDNLYIADFNNNRVRKVVPGANGVIDGAPDEIITTVAGTGVRGFSGDGFPATAAQLNGPNGINIDASGNLFIAESLGHRVRKVDQVTGIITTFAGGGIPVLGDGGPATAAQFDPSSGVAFDFWGNLYIADLVNNRIRKVDRLTGIITTVAGTGVTGSLGDGGPATAAQLNGPFATAFDSSGNLYIADSTGRRVRKIDTAGIITTFAGTGVSGSAGDSGPAKAAQVNNPQGVAVDSWGNLYISEFAGHRVRKVNLVTGIITTVAGTGTAGFSGDYGPATAAKLNIPQGIAVDFSGNLYIADVGNNRIRKVDATGIITTIAGTGIRGFSGDGGPATVATLDIPQGATVDSSGNLYIADGNRIRKVDTTGIITTIAGTGVGVFAGDGGPAAAAQLNGPRGVAVDSADNLHITDSGNSRIRRLNLATPVDVTPGTLNAKSKGKWVTAYVQFPAGWDASIVNLNTVMIQAINPADGAVRHSASNEQLLIGRALGSPTAFIDTNGDGVPDQLMVKFDLATVASWATDAQEIVLRVEGQFQAPLGSPVGKYFSGDTVIRLR